MTILKSKLLSTISVIFQMFIIIRKKFQVFNSIVKLITINVMYFFIWLKNSIKVIFHNQTMLSDITDLLASWVIWFIDKFISIRTNGKSFVKSKLASFFEPTLINSTFWYSFWHRLILTHHHEKGNMHEIGKETDNESLTLGITRF